MEMLKPLKSAIKELEQFLFIHRVVEIFKNPEIGKLDKHYELWIFVWSLFLINVFTNTLINLNLDYFLLNPDKHFNIVKLSIVIIEHGVVLSLIISLLSGVVLKGMGVRHINFYVGHIFLRVIYVFSLSLILLSVAVIIEFNNILKFDNLIANYLQSLVILFLVLCWAILIVRMLIIPIYRIANFRSRVARFLCLSLIMVSSTKINQFVSTIFPINFLNTQEIIQTIKNQQTVMNYNEEHFPSNFS